MAYQFGTNWSAFSDFAGAVTGPLLTYEVLTAFFLEAGFLGVMLFGWNRVGPGLHFFSTVMVAIGTLISTFWILASNSWMHTPQGYEIIDGRVIPVDWFAVVFNPSFPYRLRTWPRRPSSPRRSSSVLRRPGTCCAGAITRRSARCCRWRYGWRCWWRRCRPSSVTCTVSIP
jgi:hypothetical protein